MYGDQKQINDFFAITMNSRFGSRARLAGGLDLGRTVTDNCFIVDSVQDLLNCHNVKGCGANAQVKFNGNVSLPGDFAGERRLPDSSRVDHHGELGGAELGDRASRWAATSRPAGAGRRAPPPPRCRSSPPTSCSTRASLDSIFGSAKRLQVTASKRLQVNLDVFNVMNAATCWARATPSAAPGRDPRRRWTAACSS